MRAPLLLAPLLALAACGGDDTGKPADSAEEDPPPLAAPQLAVVAATEPGTFRSDCDITVWVADADSGTDPVTATATGTGGGWGATEIVPEVQYTGTATWTSCTNNDYGEGESALSTFSGAQGHLFVFRYSGSRSSFESLAQQVDFEGRAARVEFDEGIDVAAIAEAAGVAAAEDGDAWALSWEDDAPVAQVLATMSGQDGYVRGEPVWIRIPDWW